MSGEPKAWTIILESVEATDKDVLSLGHLLVERASEAGHTLRVTTVETWMFRARTAPQEPFQEAPHVGPGETRYVRRNGSRLRGRGPSY